MLTEQDKGRVYNAGIRLLARREYGVVEITKKLSQKHPPQLVQQVVAQLVEQNLLSDSRFAESLCNSRTGRGYGPIYIAQELSLKGIAKDLIEEFIDKNDPAWLERAIKAGRKKATPLLLEKDFMQSEAFEEEFLRQKGVDEHDVGAEEDLLFDSQGHENNEENEEGIGPWDEEQYDDYEASNEGEFTGEVDGTQPTVGFPKSRKFNSVSASVFASASKAKPRPKSKLKSRNRLKTNLRQKPGNIAKNAVKKVVYKKTKEQLFRERRQKDWMKVAGFLSRRGFPGDLISKAMKAIAPD
ncbi:MAG: regulatory protein RecX [Gammaproteobacteria bacterium]|jgi:regulatory protein|nr:regulatory protein RecX [Gammaproteobacteria bacterium]MBT5334458.1 regulatory protein RecX [Gammaproteobacteria bacterium]MBT5681993.1 regulatory protein RecX [Gammaproteobacteria bacterium]MBT6026051.1 regulatory protein RecX [Gammaproteobacteria bacterium]MBT6557482.1 regulatory protein RecX [Gammaproteobacteria bacterium]